MNENPPRAPLSFRAWRCVPPNRAEEEGRGRASPKTQARRSWPGRGWGHLKRAPTEAAATAEPRRAPQAEARGSETGADEGSALCWLPGRAWFPEPKTNLGESDGERKKQTRRVLLMFPPSRQSQPWTLPLKLQGVTSPLLGWSFVVSITWSITCAHQPGSQGDWKCARAALLLLC